MLDTIIATLIEKRLDGKANSTEGALLRDALREHLARNVRINLALWNLPASKPRPQSCIDPAVSAHAIARRA